MNILLLSDLHHENFAPPHTWLFDGKLRHEDADVIVLAGDIDVGRRGLEWAALEFGRHSRKPRPVIYVPGNHEHYGREIESNLSDLRQAALELGVFFLERNSVVIGDTLFLGTTLWTDFELFGNEAKVEAICEAELRIRDYALIKHRTSTGSRKLISAEETMYWHWQSRQWLEAELKHGTPSKTVIVTHHAPHLYSVQEQYRTRRSTAAFASDLSHLFGKACLWLHGHVHHNVNYKLYGTRVIASPRGNMSRDGTWENAWYDASALITV